jgi:DNA-binding HxlR family transcriptional regulator
VASRTASARPLTPGRLAQAVTGDAWTLHILRHAFHGARRYSQWRERLKSEGMPIPEPVLSDRLRRLIAHRVLERRASPASTRSEYWLSECGLELWTLLIAIRDWETRHVATRRGRGSATVIVHQTCGKPTHPILVCTHCNMPVTARDTELKAVPNSSDPSARAVRSEREPNYRISNAASRNRRATFLRSQTLQILGDPWSNKLCGALFMGCHGFDELQRFLSVPSAILANRLAKFVTLGVLQRESHSEGPRRRFYRLTDKGLALFPVVVFTVDWGNRWLAVHPENFRVIHKACGATFRPALACGHCGEHLQRKTIRLIP